MDIDKWKVDQIRNIAELCEEKPNWHIALSNPCFEVWLYYHKSISLSPAFTKNCKTIKTELAQTSNGGYDKDEYILNIKDAINNSKQRDSDKNHFLPKKGETKVYRLLESLIAYVGKNEFQKFIKKN